MKNYLIKKVKVDTTGISIFFKNDDVPLFLTDTILESLKRGCTKEIKSGNGEKFYFINDKLRQKLLKWLDKGR